LTLRPPRHRQREGLPVVTLWAVQVQEVEPPADVTPIEWLLLTTVAVDTVDDATQCVQWYSWRWGIEICQSCNLRRTLFWPKFDSLRRHTAQRAVCDGEARRHMPWGWPPMIGPTPCLTEISA
jgi:hypothetical protein